MAGDDDADESDPGPSPRELSSLGESDRRNAGDWARGPPGSDCRPVVTEKAGDTARWPPRLPPLAGLAGRLLWLLWLLWLFWLLWLLWLLWLVSWLVAWLP